MREGGDVKKDKTLENKYIMLKHDYYKLSDEIFPDVDNVSLAEIEKMIRDDTIGIGLDILTKNIQRTIGEYSHENEKIQEFIRMNFDISNKTFRRILKPLIINALTYGFGAAEVIFKIAKGQVLLEDLNVLDTKRITFIVDDERITNIRYTSIYGEKIDIPEYKMQIIQNGDGLYGQSLIRRIYPMWIFKKQLFKWWALGSEKFVIPPIIGHVEDTATFEEAFYNFGSKAVGAVGVDDKITVLSVAHDMTNNFVTTIDKLNSWMLASMFIPKLFLEAGNVGAYALSKTQMELFQDNIKGFAQNISDELIDGVIAKLIDMNFGEQDNYGEFAIMQEPNVEETKLLADVFASTCNSGITNPAEDFIREKLHFPKKSEEISEEELADMENILKQQVK